MNSQLIHVFSRPYGFYPKSLVFEFALDDSIIRSIYNAGTPLFVSVDEANVVSTSSNALIGVPTPAGPFLKPLLFVTNRFERIEHYATLRVQLLSFKTIPRMGHLPLGLSPPVLSEVRRNDSPFGSIEIFDNVPPPERELLGLTEDLDSFLGKSFTKEQLDNYVLPILLPSSLRLLQFGLKPHTEVVEPLANQIIDSTMTAALRHKPGGYPVARFRPIFVDNLNDVVSTLLADHSDSSIEQIGRNCHHQCTYGLCFTNWMHIINLDEEENATISTLSLSHLLKISSCILRANDPLAITSLYREANSLLGDNDFSFVVTSLSRLSTFDSTNGMILAYAKRLLFDRIKTRCHLDAVPSAMSLRSHVDRYRSNRITNAPLILAQQRRSHNSSSDHERDPL